LILIEHPDQKLLNADPSGNPVPRPRAGQPLQVPRDDIVQQ
jgi:hypothetical protein